jgi:uncharacterized membrane protein
MNGAIMRMHWRLYLGLAIGAGVWAGAWALNVAGSARALIGWNTGAAVYLLLVWIVFLRADEAEVRLRCGRQDESRGVILALVIVAIAASLAGIVAALISLKGELPATRTLVTALAALTLVTSWAVLQSVFMAHYAHRHFQSLEARGSAGGFYFPGDPPRSYLDFAYLTVCVGATAQVSDPGVQTTPLRNLVTAHAVTSFFYNTAVLALGINILSGLIGH